MKKEIALLGNPNSGKTSLFNELTGSNQYVGNWPGVTVEKKMGKIKKYPELVIQDLPGIYSLSPYTPEEVVTRDYLINQRPDLILNIVDATNLERNLYLTLQLLECGIPLVMSLNMMDVLKKRGQKIDHEKLTYQLGIPVIPTSVVKKQGVEEILKKVQHIIDEPKLVEYPSYDNRLEVALAEIAEIIHLKVAKNQIRWYAIKLFERDGSAQNEVTLTDSEKEEVEEIVLLTEKVFQDDSESIIINQRYEWIEQVTAFCMVKEKQFSFSLSDKIDRVITNRWLALPIFAAIMGFVYYLSMQTIGLMGTDWINDVLFGEWIPNAAEHFLVQWQVAGWMQELILDGIIAGVGAVLGFLPQLMILFLCLALLEDCGYMSRIAFVLDRIFRRFGLSGKSFIPMLIATGCGVPGIMASRTIENENDRKMTIMVTTFMPCSAKLPIIALISGALFPTKSWWISLSAYFVGMSAIILSGIILKKTRLFAGETAPFIMELPAYHLPKFKGVWMQTWNKSKSFVKKAGTIIFVMSIFIWFTSSFNFRLQMVETSQSMLASFGRIIALVFAPLGWGGWQMAVATLTGLIAKENVVSTFGILFGGAKKISENGQEVWPLLQQALTPIAGYSFLLFNLLCAPCFAAIGAMKRELVTWKWTMTAVGYQCLLAYIVSFIVYQLGVVFVGGRTFGFGSFLALILVIGIFYLLIRKPKMKEAATLETGQ